MLNQINVLKKPIGPPASGFLTSNFHCSSLRSSSVGMRSSGFFNPLCLSRDIHSVKITTHSHHQLKAFSDTLSSDIADHQVEDKDGVEECRWQIREDDGHLYMTFEMPGLDKGDVIKVMVENNFLIVKGAVRQQTSVDEDWKYCSTVKFEPDHFKIDEITSEIKNGVLKVVLPKQKKDEREIKFNFNMELDFVLLGWIVFVFKFPRVLGSPLFFIFTVFLLWNKLVTKLSFKIE